MILRWGSASGILAPGTRLGCPDVSFRRARLSYLAVLVLVVWTTVGLSCYSDLTSRGAGHPPSTGMLHTKVAAMASESKFKGEI
jgi:hypothetical protein